MALRRGDTYAYRLWRRATCLLVCAAWFGWAGPAAAAPDRERAEPRRAEPAAPRKADELTVTWRRFGVWDYLATAVALGALLTVETTMLDRFPLEDRMWKVAAPRQPWIGLVSRSRPPRDETDRVASPHFRRRRPDSIGPRSASAVRHLDDDAKSAAGRRDVTTLDAVPAHTSILSRYPRRQTRVGTLLERERELVANYEEPVCCERKRRHDEIGDHELGPAHAGQGIMRATTQGSVASASAPSSLMESTSGSAPTAPAHVEVLDGMRGLLTLLVLVHHVVSAFIYALPEHEGTGYPAYLVFAEGSAVALPMYFVISGFVIFLPAARGNGKLQSLRWYALRRIARIVPAYYACIAVQLLAWPFLFGESPSPMATRRGIELVLGHLVFLQKLLFNEVDIGFGLNGSVWTLTLEEFFYASIPLLSLFVFRHPRAAFFGSLGFTLAWRLAMFYLPEVAGAIGAPAPDYLLPSHLFHQFPGYLFQFLTGSVVALLYVRWWGKWSTSKWWTASKAVHAVCLVLLALAMLRVGFLEKYRGIVRDITYDMVPAFVFAVMILAVALGPAGPKKLYANRFCRFFGDISYGVYLWHMLVIQVVFRYGGVYGMAPGRVILTYMLWVVPVSILLGWLSFRLIERPLSQFVKRLYQQEVRSKRERAEA